MCVCVCVFFFGGGGGVEYGSWERRERQEKREKWGKLRNNGQYFVIEKKGKGGEVKKRGGGIRDCKVRRREFPSSPPPPPRTPRLPHYCRMFLALQYHN